MTADEAGTSSAKATTSSSRPPSRDFDVFLNFRGPDSRRTVVNVIHAALVRAGVRVFYDDESMRKGEVMEGELMEAITNSKIHIPIFSKDYASSKWCLRELAKIMECWKASQKQKEKKIILPIFYGISVSTDLKLRSELYTTALKEHKKMLGEDAVKPWENALQTAATIKGWSVDEHGLSELKELIVEEVDSKLSAQSDLEEVVDDSVDIRNQMDEIKKLLDLNASDVRFVAIHGFVGVGKTTLATLVREDISSHFPQGVAFLSAVGKKSREADIVDLQKDLLSQLLQVESRGVSITHADQGARRIKEKLKNKKVLIVLDDLDESDQLQKLAGGTSWFGTGTRIILTTRNIGIMPKEKGYYEHKLQGLKDDGAQMIFFSREAFNSNSLPNDDKIWRDVVKMTGGNPTAIRAIASLFKCSTEDNWSGILEKPHKVVYEILRKKLMISYDHILNDEEKEIFLDIACLFIYKEREDVCHYWEAQGHCPKYVIMVLKNFSLLEIVDGNKLWMDGLLRDLGRCTVDNEDIKHPERRSRLWSPEVAFEVVSQKKGTEKVVALNLGKVDGKHNFDREQFEGFENVKFLELEGGKFNGENFKVLPHLQWLSWDDSPPKFGANNLCSKELIIVMLSKTTITGDWGEIEAAYNLKVLKCIGCSFQGKSPDFYNFSKLERLVFKNCKNLSSIPVSIDCLRRLTYLEITSVPFMVRLPFSIGYLESLSVLKLELENLIELPGTIGLLANLKHLCLWCPQMRALPESVGKLKSLVELDIARTSITKLPQSFGEVETLKIFKCEKMLLRTGSRQDYETNATYKKKKIQRDSYHRLA